MIEIQESSLHLARPPTSVAQGFSPSPSAPATTSAAPDGGITLIDWHGAGLGPPVVDLGFLLISAEVVPSWVPPLPPDPRRLEYIVAGYARHRQPTLAELDWLPDVMRVRALLYGAAHLARAGARYSARELVVGALPGRGGDGSPRPAGIRSLPLGTPPIGGLLARNVHATRRASNRAPPARLFHV